MQLRAHRLVLALARHMNLTVLVGLAALVLLVLVVRIMQQLNMAESRNVLDASNRVRDAA